MSGIKDRKDESIINTWVDDYFVIGRVKSNNRHLACIHKNDFADDIKTIGKDCYVLKQYCTKCEILKDIEDFNKTAIYRCRRCEKDYGQNNKEIISDNHKIYYQNNKEKINNYGKFYHQIHKEEIKKTHQIHYQNNIEHRKEQDKIYYQNNKESILTRSKIIRQNNKEQLSESHKKYRNSPALFDTYAYQIDFCEDTRRSPNELELLEVKCTEHSCQKWFKPTNQQIQSRIRSINEKSPISTECRFYCSEECKQECVLYRSRMNQTPPNSYYTSAEYNIWKFEVKRRNVLDSDNNILHCEYCHVTDNLVIHHINPQKIDPHMSLDPDNG